MVHAYHLWPHSIIFLSLRMVDKKDDRSSQHDFTLEITVYYSVICTCAGACLCNYH